jgi:demethylmenaquinone methyltransferase/2-methoxy-6-polyprenyl-1,4-benzoquinol methylase
MQEKGIWFNRKGRLGQLDEKVREKGEARFGFQVLGEEEKRERVRRFFDSVAARYDATNSLLSFGLHYLWKRRAVHLAGLHPGDRVLDICGGTGDLSILSDRIVGRRGQVVLYDINWRMMIAGRDKGTNRAVRRRIRYVQGDAEQISFPADTFDVVMVGFAVRNITHMKQAFREMVRVLKPGGTFLCLEFSKPVWPLFRRLYDLYSFRVMPILGGIATGDKRAYTYLPETIRTVLLPEEFAQIFRETGLTSVKYRHLTNGIAVVHTGIKPPGENIDPSEITKFDRMASRWWDRSGDWKALHDINPLRMEFITRQAPLDGTRVLDIGCGGGILSESLAEAGARVTGIDAGADTLEIARRHARESGLSIDYRQGTVEALASSGQEKFNVITCMELLEHVPDPRSVLSACAQLLNPGGSLICATVSRTKKSFLYAIIGAEYILRLLPVGSHDHRKFIKPGELAAWGERSGLQMQDITGLGYNPFTRRYFLSRDLRVNYIMHLRKPDAGFETQEQ